ncbi:MAG TPA: hemolysin III family protein [Rhizomicrobium sp.]|nr:hemolysin III family protein [Rhizomicrobium sp.]
MRNAVSATADEIVRVYTRHETLADATIHVIGIVFAINASLWLILHVTGLPVVASVTVYCLGLLAMIGLSAAYNLTPHHRPSKQMLRRLDHAAIFIMIAATYTPLAVNRLGPPSGGLILAAIWCAATFGVAMKILVPMRFERASLALYIAMGWAILTVLSPLERAMAAVDFWLLMAGGVVYSLGIVFYLWERVPYHKAIWHGAVLAAAALHFLSIALELSV